MPVIESQPHALTVRDGTEPWGCLDRVIQDGYYAPDRIQAKDGTFTVGVVFVRHTLSTECRYDRSLTDARCTDCAHRGSGEAYATMIRSIGN